MKLLLDFDDTLFNTQSFTRQLKNLFSAQGVSEDDFNKSLKSIAYLPPGYTLKRHIDILRNDFGYSLKTSLLYKHTQALLQNSSQFLFEDTIETLEKWRENHTLILVTMGNPLWQKRKINACGIAKFFTRIHILPPGDNAKNPAIEKYCALSNEPCVFIDNKPSVIEIAVGLKPRFPHLVIIRMLRGFYAAERIDKADFTVSNLKEAEPIILRLSKEYDIKN